MLASVPRQATEFGAATAAICHEKTNEGASAGGIGAIGDRPPFADAAHQPRASKNGDMRGQRVVRTTNSVGESSSRKTVGFTPHQHAEDRQSGRLPQRCERRQRMRRIHGSSSDLGPDMADNGERMHIHETSNQSSEPA